MSEPVRPPWEEIAQTVCGYVGCSCLSILKTMDEVLLHWEAGHFDVYIDDEPTIEELKHKLKIAVEQFEAIKGTNTWECAYLHACYALEQIKKGE